jgi:hypothetical protein
MILVVLSTVTDWMKKVQLPEYVFSQHLHSVIPGGRTSIRIGMYMKNWTMTHGLLGEYSLDCQSLVQCISVCVS